MPPRGLEASPISSLRQVVATFINALYVDTVAPEYPRPKNAQRPYRNRALVAAYENGETLERIAEKFSISIARAHQIITHRRK